MLEPLNIKHVGPTRVLCPACLNLIFLLFVILAVPAVTYCQEQLHHNIRVLLKPDKQGLAAVDTVSLPDDFPAEFTFLLHAGLNPKTSSPDIFLSGPEPVQGPVPLESFKIRLPAGLRSFKIEYGGRIHHPIESVGKEQARGFTQTPGSISDDGVYLAGSSGWYPLIDTRFIRFSLTVELPHDWDAVSQGTRMLHEDAKKRTVTGWDCPEPQDEIYLIASRFSVYEKKSDTVSAVVFLRKSDESLAGKYLDATLRYIEMFETLIGPYPYSKFALVENFWETGFGMPSFTLLGPTVIRLPFIINTSYPHEILHNWWGNSVYPDYTQGNWSEGLTAYLADHLLKEQQGEGVEYRLNTLQKYSDYVFTEREFPLSQFMSRHSASTEAVGYGKALMFFHMLRRELGDKAFTAGLRHFYQSRKFLISSYEHLRESFEAISGKDLKHEFEQWVTRGGAPKLRLQEAKAGKQGRRYTVTGRLSQVQPGKPYRLRIPVAVTLEGQEKAYQTVLEMTNDSLAIDITVPSRPLRLDVDPEFDIFRLLEKDETPPAVTQVLGARNMLVVLPSQAGKDLLAGYRLLAQALARSGPDEVDVKLDTEIQNIPNDRAVTVLGWDNKYLGRVTDVLKNHGVAIAGETIRIGKSDIPRKDHSVVFAARNPVNKDMGFMLIAADNAQSIPGLARKLPHYHKYSFLAFKGSEPENVVKGRWEVIDSPMTAFLPGKNGNVQQVGSGKLEPRQALASLPPVYSTERMIETVRYLSSENLRGRAIGDDGADRAAEYIAEKFRQAGLMPGGDDGGFFQTWQETRPGKDPPQTMLLRNVIGFIPGKKQEFAGQSVVIGAHYDHLGFGMAPVRSENQGKVHPGADDNASGIAVLVELATTLKESLNPDRSIIFLAFTGEEQGRLGSSFYVKNYTPYPVSRCIGMVNLDTVGRLEKQKLMILGAGSAVEWEHIFRGVELVTGVAIETVKQDLDSSDQQSFQTAGVPAVQLFSGPHPDYHRPTDTPEKIDAAGLVKVASVVKEVVEYLSAREGPLTSMLSLGKRDSAAESARTVTLGTIPDFAFSGKGVRLSGVMDGSPAEAAGLRKGDTIIRIDGTEVGGLRDFSDILKRLTPGDKISIWLIRDNEEMHVVSEVKER